MSLKTSEVYRCLEKKTLIFGFEILDLFLVFVLLAILSFVFGKAPYKFILTWVPSIGFGVFLRVVKTGKPDQFLTHWIKYQFAPGILSAFPLAPRRQKFAKKGA